MEISIFFFWTFLFDHLFEWDWVEWRRYCHRHLRRRDEWLRSVSIYRKSNKTVTIHRVRHFIRVDRSSQVQCRFHFHQMHDFRPNLSRPKWWYVRMVNGPLSPSSTCLLYTSVAVRRHQLKYEMYGNRRSVSSMCIPLSIYILLLCLKNPVEFSERKSVHIIFFFLCMFRTFCDYK